MTKKLSLSRVIGKVSFFEHTCIHIQTYVYDLCYIVSRVFSLFSLTQLTPLSSILVAAHADTFYIFALRDAAALKRGEADLLDINNDKETTDDGATNSRSDLVVEKVTLRCLSVKAGAATSHKHQSSSHLLNLEHHRLHHVGGTFYIYEESFLLFCFFPSYSNRWSA